MEQDKLLKINYDSDEDSSFNFLCQSQRILQIPSISDVINTFKKPKLFNLNEEQDFQNAFKKNFPSSNSIINLDEEDEEYESNLYFIKKEEVINEDDFELMPLFIIRILEQKEDSQLPEYFKLDSCIKHWKVAINQYISWKIDLPTKKNIGFKTKSSSNKPLFKIPESITKNCNYVENFDWLSEKIKNLGTIKSKLKRKIEKASPEITEEINRILELTWEEAIRLFFDDKKFFEIFRKSKLTQYYEERLKEFKIRSFTENYGFLQYIKFESSPREKVNQVKLAQKRQRIK